MQLRKLKAAIEPGNRCHITILLFGMDKMHYGLQKATEIRQIKLANEYTTPNFLMNS